MLEGNEDLGNAGTANEFDMDSFLSSLPDVDDKTGTDDNAGGVNTKMLESELATSKTELAQLKQQFHSLEGRTNKLADLDRKYLDSLANAKEQQIKIDNLTEQLVNLNKAAPEDLLSDDENKSFAKSRPVVEKIAAHKAKAAISDALTGVDSRMTEQDDRVSKLEKALDTERDNSFRVSVRTAHADLDGFLNSEEWSKARQEMMPLAGRTIGELFSDALATRNSEHAISIITEIKKKTGFGDGNSDDYSALGVPDTNAGSEQHRGTTEGKVFKESALDDWHDMRFNQKTISKEQHEALIAQFEKAEREGRVIL